MEEITVILWVGGLVTLVLQYYLRAMPFYLLGELMGIGGLVATISEVDSGALSNDLGVLMTIATVVVIIYSAMNLIGYFWPMKGWRN